MESPNWSNAKWRRYYAKCLELSFLSLVISQVILCVRCVVFNLVRLFLASRLHKWNSDLYMKQTSSPFNIKNPKPQTFIPRLTRNELPMITTTATAKLVSSPNRITEMPHMKANRMNQTTIENVSFQLASLRYKF